MATVLAEPVAFSVATAPARAVTLCHFTMAHSQLKSRSFHRTFLPLASCGFQVRYASPAAISPDAHPGMTFIQLRNRRGIFRRAFALPFLIASLLRQDADVYHFQDPELLPAAFALKLLFRKKVVYDSYEDFPSAALNKEWIPRFLREPCRKILAALEDAAARCFDGVTTADPLTLRRFAAKGTSKKLVAYNFPNLDYFPAPRPHRTAFDLVYRGGLSERTGVFVLLEALRLLVDRGKPARLLLIGYFDGPRDEDALRQRLRALCIEKNVEIQGRLDHEKMAQALSRARIGVCPLLATPKFLRNIPVKVFEYWACGMPVICTDLPPIRPFLRHEQSGLLVPPGDPVALADAIARLLDQPNIAEQMGQRSRELIATRLNNSAEVQKLHRFFRALASRPETVAEGVAACV